ncbi:hypothetical protein B0A48_10070 [Cryoendolithus antarcticus]|uniref:Heterokaryon incompatibility domain-containing protein n=1 Tax=Cryoendolithus antarcticus TaxID=1507870 RepID=A0A1V8T3U6_9PEZI|nr:hypothetical protein B0A48_10070 [Cryoendolithus antarcticus]
MAQTSALSRSATTAELQGHEIRLLHFSNQRFNLSDEATRPLKLGTTTHERDVAPPYIALSYVWGDAKSQQTVIVDGRAVLMRRNLHAALLHIRQTIHKARKHPKRILGFDLSGRPRYSSELGQIAHIWADAQCIDQTNIYERNSQVRSMGETFKMATCVFAWTGVLSLSDSRILDKYYMYPHVPPELDQWAGIETLEITTASASQGAPTIDNQRISTGYKDIVSVVKRLSRAELFTRMWCAQELLVPKDLYFMCGTHVISFDHSQQLLALRASYRASKGTPYAPLQSLLVTFQEAKCLDPRDKVFAVLSLLKPDNTLRDVFPDYTLTQRNIILKTVLEIRRQHVKSSHSESLAKVAETCALLLKAFGVSHVCAGAVFTWLCKFGRTVVRGVEPVVAGSTAATALSFKYVGQPIVFSDSTLSSEALSWACFAPLDTEGNVQESDPDRWRGPEQKRYPLYGRLQKSPKQAEGPMLLAGDQNSTKTSPTERQTLSSDHTSTSTTALPRLADETHVGNKSSPCERKIWPRHRKGGPLNRRVIFPSIMI